MNRTILAREGPAFVERVPKTASGSPQYASMNAGSTLIMFSMLNLFTMRGLLVGVSLSQAEGDNIAEYMDFALARRQPAFKSSSKGKE